MLSKLHLNAVLTGTLDCYCLACESHVWSEQDAYKHIEKPIHEKNLDLCPYLDKFPSDRIRDVKKGYYCERCNAALPTIITVGLHVQEEGHALRKLPHVVISRLGTDVLIDNKIFISESVWNGIIDNICAVCNIEVEDDISIHTTERKHVMNLIEKKVETTDGGVVYRKVDGISVHCLVCNKILATATIPKHGSDVTHRKMMLHYETNQKQYESRFKMQNKTQTKNINKHDIDLGSSANKVSPKNETEAQDNTLGFYERKFEKDAPELVQGSFQHDKMMSKTCNEENNAKRTSGNKIVEHNPETSEKSRSPTENTDKKNAMTSNDGRSIAVEEVVESDEYNKSWTTMDEEETYKPYNKDAPLALNLAEELKDHTADEGTDTDNAAEFAAENKITYNKDNGNAFCRVCEVRIPSAIKNMKEHVSGNKHVKNLQRDEALAVVRSDRLTPLRKMSLDDFVDKLTHLESNMCGHVFVINDKFCITFASLLMVTRRDGVDNGLRCLCCAMNIPIHELLFHVRSRSHELAMDNTYVICNLKEEFVREVRPDVFHCGFCNLIVGDYAAVHQHLNCAEHKVSRRFADVRLRRYLPDILMRRVVRRNPFGNDCLVM